MTLVDAVNSGNPFRRKGWTAWLLPLRETNGIENYTSFHWENDNGDVKKCHIFTAEEILANDWEMKEPPKSEAKLVDEYVRVLQEVLERRIKDVEKRLDELEKTKIPNISIPSVFSSPCQHEYPNPWYGTVPPNCIKCGQMKYPLTVTYTTSTKEEG